MGDRRTTFKDQMLTNRDIKKRKYEHDPKLASKLWIWWEDNKSFAAKLEKPKAKKKDHNGDTLKVTKKTSLTGKKVNGTLVQQIFIFY